MKAFKALIERDGKAADSVMVGANSLSGAAKKAEESIADEKGAELVMVERTSEVIL